MSNTTHTPEATAKAAAFFEHIEKARAAGKDWWADALERMLSERVEQDRARDAMLAALKAALPHVERLASFNPTTNANMGKAMQARKDRDAIIEAIALAEGRP